MNGGNDPLAERALLRDALATLAECGRELGVASEDSVAWATTAAALDDPLLVLLAGEVGGGKTSLAGALAGAPLDPPADDEARGGALLTIWRNGFDPVDAVDGDVLESYRPVASLRGCEFAEVDAAAYAEGEDAAARAYAMADLVLLVFPVSDPWSKTGWEFLRGIHRRRLRPTAAVLTHADGRSGEELDAIIEYLVDTGEEALAEQVPVFAVSSTGALAAHSGESVDRELLASSGVEELRHWISAAVGSRPGVSEKRDRAEKALQQAADEVGSLLSHLAGDSDAEAKCVVWIGEEIERDHAVAGVEAAGAMAPAREAYQNVAAKIHRGLHRSLGLFGTPMGLFAGGRWVSSGLGEAAEVAADKAEEGARRSLSMARERMGALQRRIDERALGVFGDVVAGDLSAAAVEVDLETRSDEVSRRAGSRVKEAAGDRELGPAVGAMLGERRLLLWVFAGLLGAAGFGAWIAYGRGDHLLLALAGGAFAVVSLWFIVYLRSRRKSILAYFDGEVSASQEQIDRDLTRVYGAELDGAYQGYADRLGRLRSRAEQLAAARADLRERSAAAIDFASGREGNSEL